MADSTGGTPSGSGQGALARKVVTLVWLAVSGVQLVVWLLMCIISMSLHSPFWLWTVGVGGVIVGLWWYIDSSRLARGRSE